ncbi:MAG: ferrous iron transport protein B [Candidatus Omnitrophica bacterium]|nr:ferrous iron transport protein B [Candidatus Omnitrophota bacterium]
MSAPLCPPSVAETAAAARLIVTGNPNVGKSVLFQLLTGRYATVSNYPGTTVMVDRGVMTRGGVRLDVCDTPGLNSLVAISDDERVARQLLLDRAATVVQVGDAKNLVRALALTLELAEAMLPSVLALNLMDEARERGMTVAIGELSAALGIPVVPMVATRRQGLEALRAAIPAARVATAAVAYPPEVEEAVEAMLGALPPDVPTRRVVALLWLAGDRAVRQTRGWRLSPAVVETLTCLAAAAQAKAAVPLPRLIQQARWDQAQRLAARALAAAAPARPSRARRWGELAMHPIWGVPVLLGVLAVMYWLVGDLAAQRGVGFLEEIVFGRVLIPAARGVVTALVPWRWGQALLVGEYGLLTMAWPYAFAIILPIVGMFFLCFGFLEDVGYLPRLAVMAHRGCRLLGLNGKAVLPLVLGLGCDTMATMTTRILDSRRDRVLVTLLLALGIPCSAQLGVILAMLAGQPPLALGIWLGVVGLMLVVVGQAAARLLPGETSPFLYEIPPIRRPRLANILTKTVGRLEWYLKEAVPLFFLGTLLLFLLDASGGLRVVERWTRPLVVSWLGLPTPATAAFLIGFLRRDFGAAGLFALQRAGALSGAQVVVSLVTITLFVPCVAQYFMMIKERGWRVATGMAGLVTALAFLVGGLLFRLLTIAGVAL